MSDSLRQIGKYVKKSNKEGNHSLKRPLPTDPTIERARDIFDPEAEFRMDFYIKPYNTRTVLTVQFKPPPPTSCCGGCQCQVCEVFLDGNEELIVSYPYLAGTVRIYYNNINFTTFSETNPNTGAVTLTSEVVAGQEIKVCYVHSIC